VMKRLKTIKNLQFSSAAKKN
ncbi:hypothetical protein ACFRA1_07050, partial [Bacillus subtilis]